MSEWISIKNELPKENGIYICLMKNGHDEFGIFRGFYRLASWTIPFIGDPLFYSQCENITNDVSHYMKVPDAPEVKDE